MAAPTTNLDRTKSVTLANPTPPTNVPVYYQGTPPTPKATTPHWVDEPQWTTAIPRGQFMDPFNGAVATQWTGTDALPVTTELAGKAEADGTEVMTTIGNITGYSTCGNYTENPNTDHPSNDASTLPWPNATNTGVPSGTVLTAYAGPITILVNGTIIENKTISTKITINANDVIIRNCMIDAGGEAFAIDADGRNVDVIDCEITNNGIGGSAILGQGGHYLRLNIHGFENGILAQSGNLVEDCYIHDLESQAADPHIDGVVATSGSNTIIRHCHVESWDTSCVFIKDEVTISGHIVENCRLINMPGQQTAYAVYSDANGPGGGITGVIFRNNIMQAGAGGYASIEDNTVTWENNRDYVTGALIPNPNP